MDRYRSPNEGIITTMFFPLFSGREPKIKAAFTAAPLRIDEGFIISFYSCGMHMRSRGIVNVHL